LQTALLRCREGAPVIQIGATDSILLQGILTGSPFISVDQPGPHRIIAAEHKFTEWRNKADGISCAKASSASPNFLIIHPQPNPVYFLVEMKVGNFLSIGKYFLSFTDFLWEIGNIAFAIASKLASKHECQRYR